MIGAVCGIPAAAGTLATQGPLDGHDDAYLLAYPYGFKDDGNAYVYPDSTMMYDFGGYASRSCVLWTLGIGIARLTPL